MKRGTKPQPLVIKQLHGNPSHHARPIDVPEAEGELWAPPDCLNDEQRAQWHYAIENAPPGLLNAIDRECLVSWCVAASVRAKALAEIDRLGLVVKTNEGNAIQNPFLAIANRQAMILQRIGTEMGFSPSARMALATLPGDDGEGARLVGGRRAKPSDLDAYLAEKPDRLDS